ncbi:MAG: hypothetical protein NTZ87_00705 [Candidatus Nomurabacteria bacterium]|nr:hypothetical protein [Candidatus Nomurabacteria bacterium]
MLSAEKLATITSDVLRIHSKFARTPKKAFRAFDGVTPSGVHSVLLGMLALNEESLPEELRIRVALTLFGHDILEDTTATLPSWATEDTEVLTLILGMTFDEGQNKYEEMWKHDRKILLPEFFDCTINLSCAKTKKPERTEMCRAAVRMLLAYIEPLYPGLEITKMAKAFLQ